MKDPAAGGIDRRRLLAGTTAVALTAQSRRAGAQRRDVPTVGFLAADHDRHLPVFLEGLAARGWIDGRTIRIAARVAGDKPETMDQMATQLVATGVDVIVAAGREATSAASRATKTTPIVMAGVGSAQRFVSNLSRPEGNITGLTIQQGETDGKLLSLLKEAMPALSRLAVLRRSDSVGDDIYKSARALGIEARHIALHSAEQIEQAFSQAAAMNANGVFVVHTATYGPFARRIATQALDHRLPAAAAGRAYVEAGFVMSYVADQADLMRRAAVYVDRLLKGAKAGDLPVEQPTKFILVINNKVATALGLTIPPALLLRADEVIE